MNAKAEFIARTAIITSCGTREIKCVELSFEDMPWGFDEDGDATYEPTPICLKVGWNAEDMETFLNAIDRDYDSGYGRQYLFGTIWYTDGTWSERGEYDGSEWWEHHQCPDVPDCCK